MSALYSLCCLLLVSSVKSWPTFIYILWTILRVSTKGAPCIVLDVSVRARLGIEITTSRTERDDLPMGQPLLMGYQGRYVCCVVILGPSQPVQVVRAGQLAYPHSS